MRLFEAIVEANHRAVRGDSRATVPMSEFAEQLPVIALTCIDARLNRFFPGVLGLPEEQFIWLRNAGNIITSPLSSTMRSLALACAVKGGREIAVIGHTDCRVRQTTVSTLIDRFKAVGVERSMLPDNLTDFFGIFASEQQNVIRGVDFIRSSPLIGRAIPVHGLMVNIASGQLDWVVNGYETMERSTAQPPPGIQMPRIGDIVSETASEIGSHLVSDATQRLESIDLPTERIGTIASHASKWLSEAKAVADAVQEHLQPSPEPLRPTLEQSATARPPISIPLPPRIPSRLNLKKKR